MILTSRLTSKNLTSIVSSFLLVSIFFTIIFIPIEISNVSIFDKVFFYFSPLLLFIFILPKNKHNFLKTYFPLLVFFLLFVFCNIINLLRFPSFRSIGFSLSFLFQFFWLVFFLVIKNSSLERTAFRTFLLGFYLSSIGAALELLSPNLPFLRPNGRFANLEFSSFFSNPNHYANIQLLCFSILTIGVTKKFFSTKVHWINTLIAFSTILLSKSRSGLFFFLLFCGLSLLFTYKNQIKTWVLNKTKPLFFIFIIFISTAPLLLSVVSLNKRSYIWGASFNAFLSSPLLGIGAGRFGPNVNDFSIVPLNVPMSPHSMYWGLLSENGLIGFGLFLSLIYWIFRKNKLESQTKRISYLALLIFLVTQALEYHLVYYQGFSNLLFLFLVALNAPPLLKAKLKNRI